MFNAAMKPNSTYVLFYSNFEGSNKKPTYPNSAIYTHISFNSSHTFVLLHNHTKETYGPQTSPAKLVLVCVQLNTRARFTAVGHHDERQQLGWHSSVSELLHPWSQVGNWTRTRLCFWLGCSIWLVAFSGETLQDVQGDATSGQQYWDVQMNLVIAGEGV